MQKITKVAYFFKAAVYSLYYLTATGLAYHILHSSPSGTLPVENRDKNNFAIKAIYQLSYTEQNHKLTCIYFTLIGWM